MSGGCGRVVCQEDLLPGHERKGTQDRVHARSCVLDLRRTHSRMHASVLLDSIRGGLVFFGAHQSQIVGVAVAKDSKSLA